MHQLIRHTSPCHYPQIAFSLLCLISLGLKVSHHTPQQHPCNTAVSSMKDSCELADQAGLQAREKALASALLDTASRPPGKDVWLHIEALTHSHMKEGQAP